MKKKDNNNNKHGLSDFSLRGTEAFCTGAYQSHFWVLCACTKDKYADLFSVLLCSRVKNTKQRGFVAVPDENTASMKLQAEENQDAICKNVLYERESMD